MAQISAVQFNGSNAYELLVGEFVSSWPLGAVGFTDIAVGVQVYTATVSAGVKLTLRSFNAAGAVLSAQDFTYTVTNTSMWERAETTWTCPTGIDRAELRITAVGGTVLFAQPKLERGVEVGEYSTNYAPQLTLLTPTGIYTGTLTANQVIVSGGEDLASKLVTINANQIAMTSNIDGVDSRTTVLEAGTVKLGTEYNGVTIDQSTGFTSVAWIDGKQLEVKLNGTEGLIFKYDGVVVGGIAVADGEAHTLSSRLINPASNSVFWNVGITGAVATNGALNGYAIYTVDGVPQAPVEFLTIRTSTVLTSIDVPAPTLAMGGDGIDILQLKNGNARLRLSQNLDGQTQIINGQGSEMRLSFNKSELIFGSLPNQNILGVDATGVYKSIAGVKTYL